MRIPRSVRSPLLAAFCVAIAAAPLATAADENVPLTVKKVVLFSSGVGYFERKATVNGNATAELRFRTEQINDIIKSLLVNDFDGGKINVVRYASQDPLSVTLRSFGVNLSGEPTLAAILGQLRGEQVEIAGPRATKGIILGVEKQRIATGDQTIEVDVLSVLTEKGMQQFRVSELQGIRLLNESTDAELRKALAALAASKDADKKPVTLQFAGDGQRRVQVGYILRTPIWKTSYRLALHPDGKPFLQGWATVENATEEDWSDIDLSLVSGRPISFQMDLYTPLYVPRPVVELELYASLRPPTYEGGFDEVAKAPAPPAAEPMTRGKGGFGGGVAARRLAGGQGGGGQGVFQDQNQDGYSSAAEADSEEMLGRRVDLPTGVSSLAEAREAGEMFEYRIGTAVSLPRQSSAMLPIINEEIDGEKVSIYNPATHDKYPLNGLHLTNSTKLHLMQGPVTVFDEGVYAGDAKLPDVRPAEKRLIAYALDLGVEVMMKRQPRPNEIVSVRLVKGTLYQKTKMLDEREYTLKNKTDRQRTILVEQAVTDAWTLIEPKEPFERTPSLSRFKVEVPGGQTASLPVKLEYVPEESIALTNLGGDQIGYYLRTNVISPAVRAALEKLVQLRTELDRAERTRAEIEKSIAMAAQEQERIRQNIRSLPNNSDVYQRQLRKLDEIETQLEKMQADLVGARAAEEQQRNAIEEFLLSLDVS